MAQQALTAQRLPAPLALTHAGPTHTGLTYAAPSEGRRPIMDGPT